MKDERMQRAHAEDIVRAAHVGFRISEHAKTSKSLLESCEKVVRVSRDMGVAFKAKE